jgi:hypothetical protein
MGFYMIYFIIFILIIGLYLGFSAVLLLKIYNKRCFKNENEHLCRCNDEHSDYHKLYPCRHKYWIKCERCNIKYNSLERGAYACPMCSKDKYIIQLENDKTKIHESRLRKYKEIEDYLKYLRTF